MAMVTLTKKKIQVKMPIQIKRKKFTFDMMIMMM